MPCHEAIVRGVGGICKRCGLLQNGRAVLRNYSSKGGRICCSRGLLQTRLSFESWSRSKLPLAGWFGLGGGLYELFQGWQEDEAD